MAKIPFDPQPSVPDEQLREHQKYARSLGLPIIGGAGASSRHLAVVGGSPELSRQLNLLRAWAGDVWAINGTHKWLREYGIGSTFYRVDPHMGPAVPPSLEGVERAVLADTVAPAVFDILLERGAEIQLAPLGPGEDEFRYQSTAAGTALFLAPPCGYSHIAYFGCESSFRAHTHAYKEEAPSLIWVNCGGCEYVTSGQMIAQAEVLAEAARAYPGVISVVGGGFLAALVEHGDYDVTHIQSALKQALDGAA